MRIDFVTLFPEMFDSVLGSSIMKRAAASEAVSYHLHNPRDYADNKHQKVDDTPYGGGAGMVMQCQPIYDCVLAAQAQQPELAEVTRIAVTPTGAPLTQKLVEDLAAKPRLLFLCGHYEGFDQRVLDELEPMEISLGDYVLTGGELPAMVVADAVVRLIPGVIGKQGSHENDSFSPGLERLLDHPHYTRPPTWMDRSVPDVLLSGDHQKIDAWRREQSEALTRSRRPDLLADPLARPSDRNMNPATTTIILRDATEADHEAIDVLLRSCFETPAEAELVRNLREAGDAPIELVAEHAERVVGHVLFSPVAIDDGDGRLRAMGLAPLAVASDTRGRGIGKSLVKQGLRACESIRAGAVFVLDEPGYYGPLGFETASKHGFANPFGVDDPFMVKRLKPLTGSAGTVRYAPAFEIFHA
jgi:tRNA (guanine37-N1)-methyltransferase